MGGSLVVHQTSGAEVPGSNPASTTMILMRCRIIVKKSRKSQGREGNLPQRQKEIYKKNSPRFPLSRKNTQQWKSLGHLEITFKLETVPLSSK